MRHRKMPAGALLALLLSLAALACSPEEDLDAPVTKVAVLPLTNESIDPEESDYLALGITRAVITKLTQAGLQVTPWTTVRRYIASPDTPEVIARELEVEAVLVGTFELADERILVTLSLVNVDTGLQTWADEFEQPFDALFEVQRRIATGAAASLKRELTGETEAVLAAAGSASVEAYDLFLQGAHLAMEATEEANGIALSYFDRALELDPDLVEAHLGRGVVLYDRFYFGWDGDLGTLDLAEASYRRAVELDPRAMEARRGLCHVSVQRGNSEGCLRQAQAAIQFGRGPADIESLLAQGEGFSYGGLTERAIPLFRRVIDLDPGNAAAYWQLVWAASAGLDPELAVSTARNYLRRFGDDVDVHVNAGLALGLLGHPEAGESFDQAVSTWEATRSGDAAQMFLYAGWFFDREGEHAKAAALWRRGVEEIEPRLEERPDNPLHRCYQAMFYGLLGDEDASAAAERRYLENPRSAMTWYLAVTHAKRGNVERASEILRVSLREGGVWPTVELRSNLTLAGVDAGIVEKLEPMFLEIEKERRRLLEIYGAE